MKKTPHVLSACLGILFAHLTTSGLLAQTGFPNVDRPGQAGSELAAFGIGDGRGSGVAYHGGLIYTMPQENGENDMKIWDLSDLDGSGVSMVYDADQLITGVNAHGYHKSGDLLILGGRAFQTTGYQVWNQVSGGEPAEIQAGHTRSQIYPYWRIGVSSDINDNAGGPWWSYGEISGFLHVLREDRENPDDRDRRENFDHFAIWDHLDQTGVIGIPVPFGDWLIVLSDQSRTGVAIYDMAPTYNAGVDGDVAPSLIGLLPGESKVGGYWPELWGEGDQLYAVFPKRQDDSGWLVADISDPSNMQIIADVRRAVGKNNPMYCQFKDHYAFLGPWKVDLRAPTDSVLTLPTPSAVSVNQFALPIGNLLVTGGANNGDLGWHVWVHDENADTSGPTIGYHRPRPNQTNYPAAAPLSFLIHETLRTETIVAGSSFIVRPVGGSQLDGAWTFSYDDLLTFTPKQDLLPDTEYEVIFPAGGITDAAGNGIEEEYRFTFSTGGAVSNTAPSITEFSVGPRPVSPGATATFSVAATDAETAVEWKLSYGDGLADSDWHTDPNPTHVYQDPGHYDAILQVRDLDGSIVSQRVRATVMNAPTAPAPFNSSPIILSGDKIWRVNPDNDSVSRLNAANGNVEATIPVANDPRSLAADASGNIWVVCHDDDQLDIIGGGGNSVTASMDLGYGSGPIGIVIAPGPGGSGEKAYISCFNSGYLKRMDVTTQSDDQVDLWLGPTPKAIAVTGDGSRVLVTRFISGAAYGEVWDVDTSGSVLSLTRTIRLRADENGDSSENGRGVPNYLAGVTITPNGDWAYVTSKKDNTVRGELFNDPLNTDNTVRSIVSVIDLQLNREDFDRRRDLDNSDSPTGIAFSDLGDYLFIALQGNNQILVLDALQLETQPDVFNFVTRIQTGLAPQGVVVDSSNGELHATDFLGRSVTTADINGLFESGSVSIPTSTSVVVSSGQEKLTSNVLNGKRIFYNAEDTRMGAQGYISCATCHVDGMEDGRVLDFTQRGEGLRNTVDLRGRAGTGHGNVHWSGNFDEIQDFVLDIVNEFGGTGFPDGVTPNPPLGASNAGDSDLDDLAAYVESLDITTLPRSPYREVDGALSESALRGRNVFSSAAMNCAACHDPANGFTDSKLGNIDPAVDLHDVGTLSETSGERLGSGLPIAGIDTPTLYGVWATPPYLHDGTAKTIDDVFELAGGTWIEGEDGSPVNGAQIKVNAGWPDINGALGNGIAWLKDDGRGISWSGVDGGSGGAGQVLIRYSTDVDRNVDVSVNGGAATRILLPATTAANNRFYAWDVARVDVNFSSGTSNDVTIVMVGNGNDLAIDAVRISNEADLDAADVHRRVTTLSASDRSDLTRYLLELDGRDDTGGFPEPSNILLESEFTGLTNSSNGSDGFERNSSTSFDTDADQGWHVPGSPRWNYDAANDWASADNGGAYMIAQIVTDNAATTGVQTLKFLAKHTGTGGDNILIAKVYGIDGSFSYNHWNDGLSGTSVELLETENLATSDFGWTEFEAQVDFGSTGYQYVLVAFQTWGVNSGEEMLLDNVTLTGGDAGGGTEPESNIVVDPDFDPAVAFAGNTGTTYDTDAGQGWHIPGGHRWDKNIASGWAEVTSTGGARGMTQVIEDNAATTGTQLIRLQARNTEGDANSNTLQIQVYGINGAFSMGNWSNGTPTGAAVIWDSGNVAGSTFDWTNVENASANFGSGYQYIAIRVWTSEVDPAAGDFQAIDDFLITSD